MNHFHWIRAPYPRMISRPLLLLVVSLWLVACGGGAGSGDDSTTAGPSGTGSGGTADTTSSTATLTAPAAGATVSGAVTISATAADDVGVAGVQFKVDGVNLGAEIAAAPYTMTFNTTAAVNGPHTIVAVARDAAGNTTSSSPVTVTVSNAPPPAPDTTVPSVPTGLTATTLSSSQITLTWKASTDNVGVAGYRVFRNGTQVAIVTSTQFQNNGLAASTTYTFTAQAYDAAGNSSAASAAASATTLVAGAQTALGALAASMQPGEWKELVTSGYNTGNILIPSGGQGTILQYTDEAQWDPIGRKLYIIGCARGVGSDYTCDNSTAEDAKWVMYSETTNSWQTMTAPVTPFSIRYHSYDQAALDPATGDYFYRPGDGGEIWQYESGSWTRFPSAPVNAGCCGAGAIEYFPELGGLVLVEPANGGRFHLYKRSTNSWSTIPGGMPIGEYHNITEYSKARQLLYVGGGVNADRVLLMLDKQGKLTRAADAPVALGISTKGAVHTVDPITGNLLVLTWEGSGTGNTYEYNPDTNTWRQLGTHPVASTHDTLTVAAPLTEYGVIMFVLYDDAASRVYLYRHAGSVN